MKSTLDKVKAEYTETEKELEIIKKDETIEVRKYESMRYGLEETKNNLAEGQEKMKKIAEEIPQMKKEVENKQAQKQKLQAEENETVEDLRKVRTKLEENRSNHQAAQSNNRVLNALIKERQKGNIPGVLGRLGDLGGIDSKYDIAISSCCSRIDNIVVTDVNTAQKCIQFLKDHNIGRATFIALDKVNHFIAQYRNKQS